MTLTEELQLQVFKAAAIRHLKKLQDLDDIESAHSQADTILCTLLISLGYEEVIEEYNKINKWYA